jgi:hypothetical protein
MDAVTQACTRDTTHHSDSNGTSHTEGETDGTLMTDGRTLYRLSLRWDTPSPVTLFHGCWCL